MADQETDIIVLQFADSKIPEFKEVRNKDYILYGEDNKYPDYLTGLYNKSPTHNAIVNGKSDYILGSGLDQKVPQPGGFAPVVKEDGSVVAAAVINSRGETMNEVLAKSIKDLEIYGGFRWVITFNMLGSIAEINHYDYDKFRTGKTPGTYYFKNNWGNSREEPIPYDEYDPSAVQKEKKDKGKVTSKVFAYNEYRPGCQFYPLPGYVATCNYIEIEIEISKFHLSSIRNGMMPSKMIQFYTGEPTEDKKKEIENRFRKKFSGSENAGKFVLVFNPNKDKTVDVQDLSFNELDKQFEILNKTSQQQIFTGHQVTSPMLFGIKSEGQLGGNTELKTSYEIFINTYAKPKQLSIEKIVNYFGMLMGKGDGYFIRQLDPIGIIVPDSMLNTVLKPEEARELLGLPAIEAAAVGASQKIIDTLASVSPLVATKILDSLSSNEIRSLASLPPLAGGDMPPTPIVAGAPAQELSTNEGIAVANDNIKNLTGKQHQQLMRIIRQFTKGQLSKEQATVLLKTGLQLSDEEITTLLGVEEEPTMEEFAAQLLSEEETLEIFNSMGELKMDFHIIKSKRVKFSTDKDAVEDELSFFQLAFKTEVSNIEAAILDLIKKDKRITPEVIAKAVGSSTEYVTSKIASLTQKGLITSTTEVIGEDIQIERTVTESIKDIDPPSGEIETTEIYIKYSYEGPKDEKNRPFCRKLLDLDRLYSRRDIETMSQRLGYSVWDRRGGWWGDKPYCRHRWVSHVVVRKGGKK
jgi:DNA-binding Lrp family transcriptional regulator